MKSDSPVKAKEYPIKQKDNLVIEIIPAEIPSPVKVKEQPIKQQDNLVIDIIPAEIPNSSVQES